MKKYSRLPSAAVVTGMPKPFPHNPIINSFKAETDVTVKLMTGFPNEILQSCKNEGGVMVLVLCTSLQILQTCIKFSKNALTLLHLKWPF